MATFPRAASPSRQLPGPEDEDAILDEYDLYSLAHSYPGKAWPHHLPGPSISNVPPHKRTEPHLPPLGSLLELLPTHHPSPTGLLGPWSHSLALTPRLVSTVLLSLATSHTSRILEIMRKAGNPSIHRCRGRDKDRPKSVW